MTTPQEVLRVNASLVTRPLSDEDASVLLLFVTLENEAGLREEWPEIWERVQSLWAGRERLHPEARAALLDVLTRRLAPVTADHYSAQPCAAPGCSNLALDGEAFCVEHKPGGKP